MTIPTQGECDFDKPEQHLLWALRGLQWGDNTMVIPRPILEKWSSHLVATGAVHVSALWKLADENGKIDINDLPKQKIKYQLPQRGQNHDLNGAGKWVPVSAPEPSPLSGLSDEQKALLAAELRKEGFE